MPADNKRRLRATAAITPFVSKILYLIACKPIKNATFAAENIFKESNHAKQT